MTDEVALGTWTKPGKLWTSCSISLLQVASRACTQNSYRQLSQVSSTLFVGSLSFNATEDSLGEESKDQNFKYVRWDSVKHKIESGLMGGVVSGDLKYLAGAQSGYHELHAPQHEIAPEPSHFKWRLSQSLIPDVAEERSSKHSHGLPITQSTLTLIETEMKGEYLLITVLWTRRWQLIQMMTCQTSDGLSS